MKSYFLFLILLLCSPIVVLLIHMVLARIVAKINPGLSPLPVAALAVICGYPVMGFGVWQCHLRFLNGGDLGVGVVYALIVYTCLAFCYFILFTMSETARRIHILRKLKERGAISVAELAAEYGASGMLSVRLERMVALGQIECVQGRYFLKARLLWLAGSALSLWARVLRFKE